MSEVKENVEEKELKDPYGDGFCLFDAVMEKNNERFDYFFDNYKLEDNHYSNIAVFSLKHDNLYSFERSVKKLPSEKALFFLTLPITNYDQQLDYFKLIYSELVEGSEVEIEYVETCKKKNIDWNKTLSY